MIGYRDEKLSSDPKTADGRTELSCVLLPTPPNFFPIDGVSGGAALSTEFDKADGSVGGTASERKTFK